MSFLTGWIREIVVVGVLAGVAELLLPRGNTRGYVRVVVGLLVMLIILEPVFSIVGKRVVWAELENWPRQLELPGFGTVVDWREVQEYNRRIALETYRRRLQDDIAAVVGRVEGLKVVRTAVDVETRAEDPDYGSILAVVVVVTAVEKQNGEVRPVEPIGIGTERQPALDTRHTNAWPAELEQDRQRVYELLRLHFGIMPEQVDLILTS